MMQPSFFPEEEGLLFPSDVLRYFPGFIEPSAATQLLEALKATVPWRQQTAVIHAREVTTPRLTAWYGDAGTSGGDFRGSRLSPYPWTEKLLELREQVTTVSGAVFNSVLLNFYRDGRDSVAWHSDNERWLGETPVICSVSLGAERSFQFRRKEDHWQRYSLTLANGSLLIMRGSLQRDWEHRIPKSPGETAPRINLTFRRII